MNADQIAVTNILLDTFAVILALIPMTYLVNGGRYKHLINQYFLGIAIANIVMIIGDLADWMIQSPTEP